MFKEKFLSICPTPCQQFVRLKHKNGDMVKRDVHCLALVEITASDDEECLYQEVTQIVSWDDGLCSVSELQSMGIKLLEIVSIWPE